MAYQIFCDGNPLYDLLYDDLILLKPRCKLATNAASEASFIIRSNHPYYGQLGRMSSAVEIRQDGEPIFRGRITSDGSDFDNQRRVEIEGALAYFNDSIVRPFDFPKDFLDDPEYQREAASGNTVRFFLGWLIDQHNAQVAPFQQFKLGNVTVRDTNNYVYKYDKSYSKTLEILRTRLWESALGGYLCVRYEADGNYIDYLASFDTTNAQRIVYGENLLDLNTDTTSDDTISAIIPLGGEITKKSGNDYNGSYVTIEGVETEQLTLKDLPDGDISDDIAKKGDVLYSKSAVAQYGWIYANPSDTTWDDVTKAENLLSNGVDYLQKSIGFQSTITIAAFDLHLTNKEIEAFRINRNVVVESDLHGAYGSHPLSEIDIDIENPQNTRITVGEKKRGLTDYTRNVSRNVEQIKYNYATNQSVSDITKQIGAGIDGIGGEIVVIGANVGSLGAEIGGIKTDVGSLGDRIGNAESGISSVQGDVDNLSGRISSTESSMDNLSKRMSSTETEIEKLKNNSGTGGGSSGGITQEELESALEDYVTEEELESQLEDCVTEEELESQLESYVTEEELASTLEDYVTEEELDKRLEEYQKKEETITPEQIQEMINHALANSGYVTESEVKDLIDEALGGGGNNPDGGGDNPGGGDDNGVDGGDPGDDGGDDGDDSGGDGSISVETDDGVEHIFDCEHLYENPNEGCKTDFDCELKIEDQGTGNFPLHIYSGNKNILGVNLTFDSPCTDYLMFTEYDDIELHYNVVEISAYKIRIEIRPEIAETNEIYVHCIDPDYYGAVATEIIVDTTY